MRVMLGITGASGAPYAARILRTLTDAGADVGVCASAAGRQVIALEIYGDRSMDPTDALERFVTDHGTPDVRIWAERDYSAPYASGSSRTDAVVICPCSMASIGTIVGGAEANLIHRAAGVQLKERRRLVVVPRETPLSAIPAFYHLPQTIDDLIAFVAGRVVDSLGIDVTMHERWGESEVPAQ
jgi:flavin prenyltransferase